MLIACLITIIVSGHTREIYATGELLQTVKNNSGEEVAYVVDFGNATSDYEGLSGSYSSVTVDGANCGTKHIPQPDHGRK